jgi:signal transduction histidine kinase
MAQSSPASDYAELRVRSLLWRLPLVAVVLSGLLVLRHLDGLLVREYANEAHTQAVQTDALLESFLRHRFALIEGERALIANARTARESRARFATLADQIMADAPDMFSLYLLDSAGVVTDVFRRSEEQLPGATGSHMARPERAEAIRRARRERRAATTGSILLMNGARGMLVYVPVVRDGRITGFIGGAFAYQALFNDALAGQLQGSFAYRISDASGDVIAVSADFPDRAALLVSRPVSFPGSTGWTLDVAVPRFQPLISRLVTWTVGLLLLLLVIFLVLREEARARRFAAHSFDLELLSRDLLDANVRLEERAQQIAEANRAKSRFLANVSHELRTPLNAIVGYNSLAIDGIYGDLPAPLHGAHERIKTAAEHLLALVDDVLDLSKIEVGRMDVSLETTDLGALLDSVVTVIDPIAAAKGLRIDVILGRDVPRITTDPRHVRQILLNLASNAIKFTDRGSVTLVARRADPSRGDMVTITVEDTGIGIPPDDVERIFEEFEQVRPSGRGDSLQRGTGLGLAIARKLARLLGGDIEVVSREGVGSCFTLRLPISAPVVIGDPAAEAESGRGASRERARGKIEALAADEQSAAVETVAGIEVATEDDVPQAAAPTRRGLDEHPRAG